MRPITLNRLLFPTLLGGLVAAAAAIHFEVMPPICPLYNLTGFPCPLCKMTSAWSLATRGEVARALLTNPYGVLLLLAALGGIVYFPVALIRRLPAFNWDEWRRRHPWPVQIFFAGWLLNWAYVAWQLLR
ncbi:MAG TPA: DUF2752 domain-containing protein [bacterium]|nr:DUF2752 domain-containing protein [bacterium]